MTVAAATLTARVLTLVIVAYQKTLSILLGPRCRFYPSCSQYARECLEKDSLHAALLKTLKRLSRCHPLHPGGIDLP